MSFSKYTSMSVESTLSYFNVTVTEGLSDKNVIRLQRDHGKNTLSTRETTAFIIFLRQFKSAFIYLLLGAAVITFLLNEYIDTILIFSFVLINVLLGFFQEYKSEQTAKFLRKYTGFRATVIRNGTEDVIDAQHLVPGDIISIETGDIVPADVRILKSDRLVIDESTLTGESKHIEKISGALKDEEKELYKVKNIAFSGTTVIEGKGLGVVIAIGKQSELGKISKLTTKAVEISSFEKQINKFSKFILFLTILTLALVFFVHIFLKDSFSPIELLIFSIALAVGVIPEAMPLVTTFSLSLGANKLAKEKVIVKRLSAIEDLGSIQILCTDKTGTITENKLTVSGIFSQNTNKTLQYALMGYSSLDVDGTPNNAFDLAILDNATVDQKNILDTVSRIFEIPFNPDRRRNSVLIGIDGKKTLIVRGALEAILPGVSKMSKEKKDEILAWAKEEGKKGKRILSIACKSFKGDSYEVKEEETGLDFVGLLSFVDPIKSSTYTAIKKANDLGVMVKIITGDSVEVAGAVGVEIGLAQNLEDVITGEDFSKLSKIRQKEVAEKINVFARMSPEQKYLLIKTLQETYEVGFLGEGINDAPALKASGVSIVVDNAADVSREVSDIILLKHNLEVLINGIELGRKTFVNTTNYVKATLASNFGNFYAMVFVTLIIDFLPMLPIQILLVNLLSDFPMISIATDNIDRKDILNPKSYSVKEIILLATILGLVSTTFDFIMFGFFKGYGEASLQTYWFIGSILTELLLIYSIRTKGWFFNIKNLPSRSILILTFVATAITVFIPFTPFGINTFRFVVPNLDKLLWLLFIVVGYLFSTELVKRIYYKYVSYAK